MDSAPENSTAELIKNWYDIKNVVFKFDPDSKSADMFKNPMSGKWISNLPSLSMFSQKLPIDNISCDTCSETPMTIEMEKSQRDSSNYFIPDAFKEFSDRYRNDSHLLGAYL